MLTALRTSHHSRARRTVVSIDPQTGAVVRTLFTLPAAICTSLSPSAPTTAMPTSPMHWTSTLPARGCSSVAQSHSVRTGQYLGVDLPFSLGHRFRKAGPPDVRGACRSMGTWASRHFLRVPLAERLGNHKHGFFIFCGSTTMQRVSMDGRGTRGFLAHADPWNEPYGFVTYERSSQFSTRNRRQLPGTPFSSCSPRS